MKVAIQGIKGSFHEIATFKFFGEREPIDTVECDSFPMFFKKFKKEQDFYGVMAIENTVAGTILPNYALLRNSDMGIVGEVYLRIQHNLMALNGQNIHELTEVHSHPMAILQCQTFFDAYPHIRLIESPDTALSAKEVWDNEQKGIGAIASNLAANYYHLDILAEGIETNKRNFTRFLVLRHRDFIKPNGAIPNKASICFNLAHKAGSLAQVLQIFAANGINLSKIQSLPVIGKVWEYFFHIDVEFDDYQIYQSTLKDIQPYMSDLQILGEYRIGNKHREI